MSEATEDAAEAADVATITAAHAAVEAEIATEDRTESALNEIVTALQEAGYVIEELDGGFGIVNVWTKPVTTEKVFRDGEYVATLTISRTPGY